MLYNNIEFKPYDANYYVSASGDVFSTYKKGLLKHYIDCDGYHRVDIHSKHMKIHKLVFLTWIGEIPHGKQINHRDDDKNNNHYTNLYLGTQKENIADCMQNCHRVGRTCTITVLDKLYDKVLTFPSIKDFLKYTGHSVPNGSLKHAANKKWFQNRFDVIERKGVTTIESYKSIRADFNSRVENKADRHEASRVGWNLSPSPSARDIHSSVC